MFALCKVFHSELPSNATRGSSKSREHTYPDPTSRLENKFEEFGSVEPRDLYTGLATVPSVDPVSYVLVRRACMQHDHATMHEKLEHAPRLCPMRSIDVSS